MAKRNSMSAARRSRNRDQQLTRPGNSAVSQVGGEPVPERAPRGTPAQLAAIARGERAQLMKARAVLGCVAFTLLYEDWLETSSRPCFADAIAAVQELLDEAIERLGAS